MKNGRLVQTAARCAESVPMLGGSKLRRDCEGSVETLPQNAHAARYALGTACHGGTRQAQQEGQHVLPATRLYAQRTPYVTLETARMAVRRD